MELFIGLDANDQQLEYPLIYGWATPCLEDKKDNILSLLDMIIEHVPHPTADRNAPFSMLVTVHFLSYRWYLLKIAN